jgi:beta-phosphoglucomutase
MGSPLRARMHGIVFDFDGVLCASMAQHAEAYRRLLGPLGVTVTDRDVYMHEGARSESIIKQLMAEAGSQVSQEDVAALANEKQAMFRAMGLPTLYPGAADMIRGFPAALPLGLVTGTRRDNLERIIPELLPRFNAVLAQADYQRDKPDPEPYARAAGTLSIEPADLVAVENAPRGVRSAKSAGYGHVIGICTTVRADDLLGADETVPNHAALREALQARINPE